MGCRSHPPAPNFCESRASQFMVGTKNNVERTGDRDLDFSATMRKPKGIRACDFDVVPICPMCNLPILLWEVKRQNKGPLWAYRHSTYVRNMARILGVPAYFVYHQPELKRFDLTSYKGEDLPTFSPHTFSLREEVFIAWIEKQQAKHVCRKTNSQSDETN